VETVWVGAAPGNAGGRGAGDLGAHGTRIPFGGDVAGANLEVLLGVAGITRNETFITAAYNRLPARGGGEPTPAEIRAPAGDCPSSLHLLRDTFLATRPRLVIALGNVALRALCGALHLAADARMPGLARIAERGAARGRISPLATVADPDDDMLARWRDEPDGREFPALLWITHPSAQNMSPFARPDTRFHQRMLEARTAVRNAVRVVLHRSPPHRRPPLPENGIYDLPEWREGILPRLTRLDDLWRAHGL
jgi:uracil-DNA glycosylase